MRSLFVKFFLSFMLIIILIASTGILLTYLRDQEFPPLPQQHFARQAIAEYGRGAMQAYEEDGIKELAAFTDELFRESGIRLVLFSAEGRPLTDRPVPRRMLHMAQRALRSGEVVFPMMGARNWLASPLQSPGGTRYAVSIGLPERPEPRHLARGLTHGFLGWQLLLLLGVTALVCYFLARSLTAPIGRLRNATREFAAGNLSIRVAGQVRGQNELARLAKDFDEMAGRIEDLIGAQQQLLRDISHELRSPLARLGVALELARQEGNETSRHRALERIELEAGRMNAMIGQLLSLTRLESGVGELQREAFDVGELIDSVIQDAAFEAANRDCRVVYSGPPAVPFVGHPELLGRALENIIRNALRYTAAGSEVALVLARREHELSLCIRDQGPGVPEEALDKLFEPFYRVDAARDRHSGGTGIGLTIAERAIRLHGGRVVARNRDSGGLEVCIRLPKEGLRGASN